MVLDGILRLEHAGHHTITLNKFETDHFLGDWETHSYGRVTDFNLMTTGKTSGTLEGFYCKKGSTLSFQFQKNFRVLGLYIYKGSIKNEALQIEEGEMVMFWKENDKDSFSIHAIMDAELLLDRIAL